MEGQEGPKPPALNTTGGPSRRPGDCGRRVLHPQGGARGGAGRRRAVGARARPGGLSSGQAQQARKGQDRQRRGDKRRAIGEAVHSLAPAPTMRRRLSPSTMRRPPHRNKRSLPSAPRRRSVAVLKPEIRAACDSVKDSAPTMGGGAFSRSFGINHPFSREGRKAPGARGDRTGARINPPAQSGEGKSTARLCRARSPLQFLRRFSGHRSGVAVFWTWHLHPGAKIARA